MAPVELDAYDVLDERFNQVCGDVRTETLFEGCRWAEGPVYVPAGRYLLWSDIPNDRMLRWDELTGATGVFRHPAGYPNGNTLDAAGMLVSCEHGNRAESEIGACHLYRVDPSSGRCELAADGVHCYLPDGTLLGKLPFRDAVANIEFGGAKRNRLFICASTALHSIMLAVKGSARPYDRAK